MSEQVVEARLGTLERRLRRSNTALSVICGALVIMIMWRTQPVPAPSWISFDEDRTTYFDLRQLRIYGTELDQTGLLTHTLAAHGDVHELIAGLSANPYEANVGLTTGQTTFDVTLKDADPVVLISVSGKVTSLVTIDTDTGEWKLSRNRKDNKGPALAPETIQLVPPLAEPRQ